MDTLKCPKLKFHDFAEHQGWLLLYDKMTEEGSKVSYLLQSGTGIVAWFNENGEISHMTDGTNAGISVEEKQDESNLEEDD